MDATFLFDLVRIEMHMITIGIPSLVVDLGIQNLNKASMSGVCL